MRLIDADTLLKEWRLECGGACFIRKDKYCMHYDRTKGVCTLIIKAPTVEPRKHGRWVDAGDSKLHCTNCHRYIRRIVPIGYDYCPNCGARMEDGENESSR